MSEPLYLKAEIDSICAKAGVDPKDVESITIDAVEVHVDFRRTRDAEYEEHVRRTFVYTMAEEPGGFR